MNLRNRLISNSLLNVASIFVNGVLQVILVPVLLITLKDNGVGILAAIGTFHTYSLMLNLGFGSAIDRYVPGHLVRNEMDEINIVVNTSLVYFMIVFLLIIIGTTITASNFVIWFYVTPDLAQITILGIYITGLLLAIRMPLISYAAILAAMHCYDLIRITELGLRTLRTAAIISLIWFLSQKSGLIFVIILNAMDPLLTSLLQYWLANRLLPTLRICPKLARWACFREMIGYSINSLAFTIATIIISESSILIILYYMSDTEAGRYSIPLYLVRFFNLIVAGFTQAIKPAVSKLEAEGNFKQIRQVLLQGSRYANFLIITISLGLGIAGKLLLLVWVGPLKADLWPLLTIMTLGYGAFYSQYVSYFVMAGLGRHVVFGLITIAIGISSMTLTMALLKYTNWGLVGVAAGSSVPLFLGSVLVIPIYTCKSLRVPIGEYLHRVVLQPLLAILPLSLVCAAASYWGTEYPAITLMALVIVASIVIALCIWNIALTDSERSMLTEMRRRRLAFLPAIGQLIR